MIKPPENDVQQASERNILFEVCIKEARGKPWITVIDKVSLPEAMERAFSITSTVYEVGVICLRSCGGFIYWTSKNPTFFNSEVITVELK